VSDTKRVIGRNPGAVVESAQELAVLLSMGIRCFAYWPDHNAPNGFYESVVHRVDGVTVLAGSRVSFSFDFGEEPFQIRQEEYNTSPESMSVMDAKFKMLGAECSKMESASESKNQQDTKGTNTVLIGDMGGRRVEINFNAKSTKRSFSTGDTLRMPHYETAGGYRVWKVEGVHLGGEKQEGTYHLKTVDIKDNAEIHVPCIILETHPSIEVV
jgi:hypothetical protein